MHLSLLPVCLLALSPFAAGQTQTSDWVESPSRPGVFAATFLGQSTGFVGWEAYATSIDGRIVSMTTADEELFWRNTLPSGSYWIGLERQSSASPWIWSNGAPLTWSLPWSGTEPQAIDNHARISWSSVGGASLFGVPFNHSFAAAIIEVDGVQDCDGDGVHDPIQVLNGGSNVDFDGDGTLDVCESPATVYCESSIPNSRGLIGQAFALGSTQVADNDFDLYADSLPFQVFGFWFAAQAQASIPGFAGSEGTLCLGAPIVRFNVAPYSIFTTDNQGRTMLELDLTTIPQVGAIQAGQSWNFQAWYRDFNNGMLTSNTTQALNVTFQ